MLIAGLPLGREFLQNVPVQGQSSFSGTPHGSQVSDSSSSREHHRGWGGMLNALIFLTSQPHTPIYYIIRNLLVVVFVMGLIGSTVDIKLLKLSFCELFISHYFSHSLACRILIGQFSFWLNSTLQSLLTVFASYAFSLRHPPHRQASRRQVQSLQQKL